MIRRITLTNFMSHRNSVIELSDGLNVITGCNNSGKSAIVEALRIVCENASGAYMVRHGESDCRVTIETDESDVIQWRRIKGKVSYEINGREIDRLKGSVPDDLHERLRLPPVEADGDAFDVHFGMQREPIFLLHKTARHRAAFFASSSDAIRLLEMQSLHKAKVKDAGRQQKQLLARHSKMARRLEKLSPLDEIEKRQSALEAEYEAIQIAASRVDDLRQRIESLRRVGRQRAAARASLDWLKPLSKPPQLKPLGDLRQLIARFSSIQVRQAIGKRRCLKFESLQPPPSIKRTDRLQRMLDQWVGALGRQGRSQGDLSALRAIPQFPEFQSTESLHALRARWLDALALRNRQRQSVRCMRSLDRPPRIEDAESLFRLVESLRQAAYDLKQRKQAIAQVAEQRAVAERELRERLEGMDSCPTCGQPIDPDQMVEELAVRPEPRE